jgi:hypothetical protein
MKYFTIATITIILSSYLLFIGYTIGRIETSESPGNVSQDWSDVGGNIDIEYYLEVSGDSVWIENYNTHKVYGGTYTQLDSLILIDNL